MHQPILTSAAILLLLTGTAGGCRNTDQPEKKAPASTPPAKQVEPSKPAESGSDSGKPTDPQQKVPAVNTTTTATSPLITKKHTPTKPG